MKETFSCIPLLLYECNPLAYMVEVAGGRAMDTVAKNHCSTGSFFIKKEPEIVEI